MKNPPCICFDVFIDAALGQVDRETWMIEYEQWVLSGHVASCHHRSHEPKSILRRAGHENRILARVLNDVIGDGGTPMHYEGL